MLGRVGVLGRVKYGVEILFQMVGISGVGVCTRAGMSSAMVTRSSGTGNSCLREDTRSIFGSMGDTEGIGGARNAFVGVTGQKGRGNVSPF